MKVIIGSDHAAFEEKEKLKAYLIANAIEVVDVGTSSSDRCDYPDFASALTQRVVEQSLFGILLCGTGIGVSMVANRYAGARAALCRSVTEAKLARAHNDSNILCLGARISSIKEIESISDAFLSEKFEAGRHAERIALFNSLGEKSS